MLLYYKFTIQFAGERIVKIGEHMAKLLTRWWFVFFDSQYIIYEHKRRQACRCVLDLRTSAGCRGDQVHIKTAATVARKQLESIVAFAAVISESGQWRSQAFAADRRRV